jgi:hypothetical protein
MWRTNINGQSPDWPFILVVHEVLNLHGDSFSWREVEGRAVNEVKESTEGIFLNK